MTSGNHISRLSSADDARRLPWDASVKPLMLAPMQGLTNRAMRALFVALVRPDTVFTEFMRVSSVSRKRLARNDLVEAGSTAGNVPLVAQLVGNGREALVAAAQNAEAAGARHLNLNLGCPYGRMSSGATGGALLKHPDLLAEIIPALRAATKGSFSLKLRAGYDDPEQIFDLLPLCEQAGVDFLVLHPRTVAQKYGGSADHTLTGRVVRATHLPVIANGDIRTAAQGRKILGETGAAGLMLGRGALADPLLFERLRNCAPEPDRAAQAVMLHRYLGELIERYSLLFCGEQQVLSKLKDVVTLLDDPATREFAAQLKKCRTLHAFTALVEGLSS